MGRFPFKETGRCRPARPDGAGLTAVGGPARRTEAGAPAGDRGRGRRLAEVLCRLPDLGSAVLGVFLNDGTYDGQFGR
ncbi:hypothetical protein SSP35_19_00650 [Streptomyces sp. NBRC 110611]|uniref:hypothetical protein n=1 Tax=Streptomyces sp. NBRC 110611 TaxID=1621259 RepID=UPI0008300CFB|nr:hypothetical protein [Streptomyces sp. NBRC 110611]GAU70428.1 hypothetical protein SSP35_19_00650 [Streptomyces sp. NBRC 110611]